MKQELKSDKNKNKNKNKNATRSEGKEPETARRENPAIAWFTYLLIYICMYMLTYVDRWMDG